MCWSHVSGGACTGYDSEQNGGEGITSYHTRVHEGGSAIFLQLSSGLIICIQNGTGCLLETPYRNKYGEPVGPQDKDWDSFKIDQIGGGLDALNHLR